MTRWSVPPAAEVWCALLPDRPDWADRAPSCANPARPFPCLSPETPFACPMDRCGMSASEAKAAISSRLVELKRMAARLKPPAPVDHPMPWLQWLTTDELIELEAMAGAGPWAGANSVTPSWSVSSPPRGALSVPPARRRVRAGPKHRGRGEAAPSRAPSHSPRS
jgi:hypothetical protein